MADEPDRPPADTGRGGTTRFKPGVSGNPSGRPKGARATAYAEFDALAADAMPEVPRTIIEAAKGGDMRAAEMVCRRTWPEAKGRRIVLDLPPIATAADLELAAGNLIVEMAEGRISPEEASTIGAVIDVRRRTFETVDFANQLAELQEQVAALTAARNGGSTSDADE